jgi:hypothetical protein
MVAANISSATAGWSPEIWTGKWRWIAELANYTDPERQIKSQLADVKVVGNKFWLNQRFELKDGTKMGWTWDGAFDGKMRPILWDHDKTELIDIAFYMLKDGLGGDAYSTKDGSKVGTEYYRLEPNRLDVWGCYTVANGTQYPYKEAWERIG